MTDDDTIAAAEAGIEGFPGQFWHALQDGRLQCDLCPRFCKLRDGQRGLCFVRARKADEIVLTTYGRSSGFCIDPIEKKPLNHFLPGSAVLSFGTAGCNLACKFCQNWDISKSREFDRLQDLATPGAIAGAAFEADCQSVAFTYNDPVIFYEYALDVARACHARDIKTVAVTAGYISAAPRKAFFEHIDAANIDLKGFTDRFYRKICGGHLQPVLDTIRYLRHETDVWFELTELLIPGENDSTEEIEAMCRWIVRNIGADVPLHFSAFHPDWRMLDKPRTPFATLQQARDIALRSGLHHVYTGNVDDPVGASSYCHACGEMLIERNRYELSSWNIQTDRDAGHCGACGTRIAGVFAARPGCWGARRVPIRIQT